MHSMRNLSKTKLANWQCILASLRASDLLTVCLALIWTHGQCATQIIKIRAFYVLTLTKCPVTISCATINIALMKKSVFVWTGSLFWLQLVFVTLCRSFLKAQCFMLLKLHWDPLTWTSYSHQKNLMKTLLNNSQQITKKNLIVPKLWTNVGANLFSSRFMSQMLSSCLLHGSTKLTMESHFLWLWSGLFAWLSINLNPSLLKW